MSAEPRRWTLTDWSDDYNPKWAVGDFTPPPALEHLEQVVVMPVSEHEAALAEIDEAATRNHEQSMARLNEIKAALEAYRMGDA